MKYIVPVKILAAIMVDAEEEAQVPEKAAEVAQKFSSENVKKLMFDFMLGVSKELNTDVILVPSVVLPEKEQEHVELVNSFVNDYVRRCAEGANTSSSDSKSSGSGTPVLEVVDGEEKAN